MSIDSIALRFSLRSPSSTSPIVIAAATTSRQREILRSGCDLGELGDRDELVAGVVGCVDDLGHRVRRLRAVVAHARAVAVVQQQDRPRAEAGDGAAHDLVRAGLGGVPDALRPADDAVAAALGGTVHERVPETVRGAEQLARRGARRVGDRDLRPCERRRDVVGLREREQRVVVAVRGDLVAVGADRRDDLRVLVGMPPQHEERRLDLARAQHLEHDGRRLERGPVVERERDHAVDRAVAVDDAAEEGGVRRERAPGEHRDARDDDGEQQPARPAGDRRADDGRGRGGERGAHDREEHEAREDLGLLHRFARSSS